jgi:hypothetical protein
MLRVRFKLQSGPTLPLRLLGFEKRSESKRLNTVREACATNAAGNGDRRKGRHYRPKGKMFAAFQLHEYFKRLLFDSCGERPV